MVYSITKKQEMIDNFKINMYYFNSARESFEYILKTMLDKTILIPAYIGYSSNEGSGIFDPICNTKIDYKFYKFTVNLDIDTKYLYKLIDENPKSILLLVHYFGFKDTKLNQIKEFAKQKDVIIIEDCAHSFFTFFESPTIDSDYCIFSLHKMFAYDKGGLLISKNKLSLKTKNSYNPFEYNLYQISKKRVENYNYIKDKIKNIDNIKLLKLELSDNIPQTFPILLENVKLRDSLYFKLNEEGFGVVSLYHELIKEIPLDIYVNEDYISQHILNLPIHQDATIHDIDVMIDKLEYLITKYR